MGKKDKQILQYGYQPEKENRGYQPSVNTQNDIHNSNSTSTNSEPPKGGNVAQKQ